MGTGTITTPNIISVSGGTVICGGQSGVMLRLQTVYTETNVMYQWFIDNVLIQGATQPYYYATVAGNYTLFVTIDDCSALANISVTYDGSLAIPSVDLKSQGNATTLCSGSGILLYVNNESDYGSGATYVWYDDDKEIARGVGMSNYLVDTAGIYSVLVYETDACLSKSIDTITITIVDSLSMGTIISSVMLPLQYNTGTDLTVTNVQGSIAPYVFTWYKRKNNETTWTQIPLVTTNPLSTGNVTDNTWFKVVVSSSNSNLSCNVVTDSIFIGINQVELSLEILTKPLIICNSLIDSLMLKISNTGDSDATNVLLDFYTDGTLPIINSVLLPFVGEHSDTIIKIGFAGNTNIIPLAGILKAEIISCNQSDMNPATIYGSWQAAGWSGDPAQADEDMVEIVINQNLKLITPTLDSICSGEVFEYDPQANISGTTFTWIRYAVSGIAGGYSTGTGSVSQQLINEVVVPVTTAYTYTLSAPGCTSLIYDTVYVTVLPKTELITSHMPANGGKITFGTPVIIRADGTGAAISTYIFADESGNRIIQTDNEYLAYIFNQDKDNAIDVTIINEYGCKTTGVETFNVAYDLPNVITPNETTNSKLFEGYDRQVFNRWGAEVYRGDTGWDGKYNGTLVVSGTYYYVLHLVQPDGKIVTIKRFVFVKY
jgi:hypothetical protein